MSHLELRVTDTVTNEGLPVIVVDEDFLEFLAEEAYDEYSIDMAELALLYVEWAKENVCN